MLRIDYQLLIVTKRMDFKEIIDLLNKNIYVTDNISQKKVIEDYKEYLLNVYRETELFNTELIEAFNMMKHLGINILKMTDEKKIYKILYECINKIAEGVNIDEY